MVTIDLLFAVADICATGDCFEGASLNPFADGVKEVMRVLVGDNGQSVFAAVIVPCSLFAGLGIIYGLAPLLTVTIDRVRADAFKIIIMLLLASMFMGGGKMARAVGIANYATIKGIDRVIHDQMEAVGGINKLVSDAKADGLALDTINKKLDTCQKILRIQADGTPNPASIQCEAELRQTIQAQKMNNPDAATRLQTALSKGDLMGMANAIVDGTVGLPGWIGRGIGNAAMEVPKAIFSGWKAAVLMAADVAFALSLMILPIPLSFSLLSAAPLMVWLSSLWAVGFYQFSLTVLSGSFTIIAAKLGPGLPLFTVDLLVSLVAPILAGIMAAGGGIGLFKLFQQVATTLISLLGKAAGAAL